MRAFRTAFAWCFAVAAALCLWQARMIGPATFIVPGSGNESAASFKSTLIAVTLLLACLFAVAGYVVLKQRPSAGRWGMAASIALILGGFLFLYGRTLKVQNPSWIAIALGVAGMAVFSRRVSAVAPKPKSPPYPPVPGSGAHPIVNKLILVAGIAGGTGGVRLWAVWAAAHGLPLGFSPFFVFEVVLSIFVVLAFHEAGHALAGMAVRMKLIGYAVGPFYWFKTYGRWIFTFRAAGLLSFVGQTMVAPTTLENFRNRKALQVAAGPVASLAAGLAGAWAILTARGNFWAPDWGILAVFVTITSLVGLLNLIPFGSKTMYSDGAKLYQLLSGGLWSDYHRALGIVSATAVTPLRPRDYDIATLEQAAVRITQGTDQLFLYLCAYSFYLDSGRLAEAVDAIGKAERSCREWALDPPAEWTANLVFSNALLRHDAAAAQQWWTRMEARKNFRFTENLWDARGALLLSEGRLDEAAEALAKADAWASQLPDTGTGDMERDSVRRLRQALEEAHAAQSAQAAP